MVYKSIAARLARALPQPCLLCGAHGPEPLCPPCRAELPALGSACTQCALPLPAAAGGQRCGACLANPPAFDLALAAFHYQSPVRELLHMLKFGACFSAASVLGDALADAALARYAGGPKPDLVIPVPLHLRRLGERGYNQAQLLARPAALRLGRPLLAAGCIRQRETDAQSGLDHAERRRNLKHAFGVNADVQGKCVAIVDDVMTTGSTLETLARALKRAGAREVHAWCVARTDKHD